jgi:hypothetical protein
MGNGREGWMLRSPGVGRFETHGMCPMGLEVFFVSGCGFGVADDDEVFRISVLSVVTPVLATRYYNGVVDHGVLVVVKFFPRVGFELNACVEEASWLVVCWGLHVRIDNDFDFDGPLLGGQERVNDRRVGELVGGDVDRGFCVGDFADYRVRSAALGREIAFDLGGVDACDRGGGHDEDGC